MKNKGLISVGVLVDRNGKELVEVTQEPTTKRDYCLYRGLRSRRQMRRYLAKLHRGAK